MTDTVWQQINARPLTGRKWGAAVPSRTEPIPLINERTMRPRFGSVTGKCPHCGARYFGCCDRDLENDNGD